MANELTMTPEAMREIGRAVVDRIVDQMTNVERRSLRRGPSREAMGALFAEPIPDEPAAFEDVLARVCDDVFANAMPLDHPRFFGFVPSPTNFVSVMSEALVASLNPFLGSWLVSAGPTTIELTVIDWLRSLCGLPDEAGGLLVSGGSMATLTALTVARDVHGDGSLDGAVAYCSDQTHTSVDRALRVLGAPDVLRHVPHVEFRLDPSTLRAAVAEDRARGKRPWCVIANAGTTNTGAIDPLREIADVCAAEGLWLHVDGAYGAPAVLTEKGAALLDGIGRADSLTLDPHKWLFQPYEVGCLLVRSAAHLPETFDIFRDYMRDVVGAASEVNLRNHGIQLTRSFRALKLWMSIQVFGLEAFRRAVAHGIACAEHAERLARERDDWELVTPASIGIVTFRHLPDRLRNASDAEVDAHLNTLVERMYADGYAMMSSTEVHGRPVLRLCTINPRTTFADIEGTFDRFEMLADV